MIPIPRAGWGYTREGTDRAAPRLQFSMRKRKVQPGRKDHIIIFRAHWRVGDIDVTELILPAQPLADLRDRAEVKLSSIPAGIAAGHVRVEIQLLHDHRALPGLVHQFFTQRKRGESARYTIRDEGWRNRRGRDLRSIRISFVGVVNTGEKIQRGAARLDRVVAQSAAVYAEQIQVLQRVAREVSAYKAKESRVNVVIVPNSCRDQVSHSAGCGQLIIG